MSDDKDNRDEKTQMIIQEDRDCGPDYYAHAWNDAILVISL